ncbi:MAG: hypothetical protein KKI03_11185, partial [Gammaproteobacteria bacterium]|nr:hypothetical protein [Gammaproteobacteria bacterium]
DIVVFDDRVVLMIENATLSSYSGSGSMKPFFDVEGSGYGFRVVKSIAASRAELPSTCKMQRPLE